MLLAGFCYIFGSHQQGDRRSNERIEGLTPKIANNSARYYFGLSFAAAAAAAYLTLFQSTLLVLPLQLAHVSNVGTSRGKVSGE